MNHLATGASSSSKAFIYILCNKSLTLTVVLTVHETTCADGSDALTTSPNDGVLCRRLDPSCGSFEIQAMASIYWIVVGLFMARTSSSCVDPAAPAVKFKQMRLDTMNISATIKLFFALELTGLRVLK